MPNLTTSADIDAFMAAANDAAARTELGLTTLATTTPGTGVATALGVNIGTAGSFVVNGGALGSPSTVGTLPAHTLGGTISGGGQQINNVIIGTTTPLAGTFTTVVAGSATSLLVGTAGSAVGSVGFRNATSGTATVAPPTGALGTYQVTLPNAASTLPIFGQQITFAGPTQARTITLPDAAFTVARTDAANTFTGVQSMTSPSITTSIVSASATLAVFNATATTVNAFGAATALNIGASAATVLNFGGFTSAAELRFLEPSGSGTNYSGFKQPALGTSITYQLPSDAPTDGQFLSCLANGTMSWETSAGSGDVSGPVSSTDNAIAVWNGTGGDTLEDSSITITGGDTLNATNIDATNATVDALVAGAATMALFNTVATTINFAGVATALNVGAGAATILNFGGFTSAAELRFLEPSGSGTNYSGFKQPALGTSITYLLPSDAPTDGQFLSCLANGTLSWETAAGSGNVTAGGTLTSGSLVIGQGTTAVAVTTTGTGVVTALGVNVGTAGAFVVNGGALGSPSTAGTMPAFTLGGTVSGGGQQLNNVIIGTTTPLAGTFTTLVAGSTTSLLLGTAGSAVGNIGFRNATSGTATLTPPTGALGTYNVTLPNAASTLPIYGQQITYSGPTAARTITLPDENFSVGFRGVPQNAKTGSYTLLATDNGRVIPNTTGGWTVNNSVHTAGDVITVYNDSGSSQNITAGTITTMRLAGTASTGTRALAQRGLATLYFQTATEVIVSGAGVT